MSDTSRYTSPFSERYASAEMQYIFSQDKIMLSAADAAPENLKAVNEYVRDNGKY